MLGHAERVTTPRRGRRPGSHDTRTALLDAARAVFAESGYDGATVRSIATRAGVDAAMVKHWFGSKEGLFAEAVLKVPFNPQQVIDGLLAGAPEKLGERIVRTFLAVWDAQGGGVFVALVSSVASHEQAAHVLRDFLSTQIFSRVAAHAGTERAELRASLCASQLVGLGMVRYVLQLEPLASAPTETAVAAIAPTVQRYLSGLID